MRTLPLTLKKGIKKNYIYLDIGGDIKVLFLMVYQFSIAV